MPACALTSQSTAMIDVKCDITVVNPCSRHLVANAAKMPRSDANDKASKKLIVKITDTLEQDPRLQAALERTWARTGATGNSKP